MAQRVGALTQSATQRRQETVGHLWGLRTAAGHRRRRDLVDGAAKHRDLREGEAERPGGANERQTLDGTGWEEPAEGGCMQCIRKEAAARGREAAVPESMRLLLREGLKEKHNAHAHRP